MAELARAEVGFAETEGANSGPRIRAWQAATWKPPGPWPYCAAFVAWCLQKWLLEPSHRILVGAPDEPGGLERWRFREPGARMLPTWAVRRGLRILQPGAPLEPGDLVVFDFRARDGVADHCGIVAAPETTEGIETIEGNTDAEGSREGDGVWPRLRRREQVLCAVRLEVTDNA